MKHSLLFRMAVLVAAVMCALGVNAQEAYAVYTSDNTTFTFYYDNERSSRPGTTYDLNTGHNDTGWETDETNYNVTKVVFDPSFADARPTSTFCWFYNMESLETIEGIEYLNTSEVTIMGYMFHGCIALKILDLSTFNTSKVTEMNDMFYDCISLNTIYVGEGWTTEAVENSMHMFHYLLSIVGAQGTTYNESNPKDKTYAHIDGGPSNPGYFTDKNASLRGDVNGDHLVNITDAIDLISYILNDAGDINLEAANVNGDDEVNVSDTIAIINYVLNDTW